MALSLPLPAQKQRPPHRYLRQPAPLFFPVEEELGESGAHRLRMSLLERLVRYALGEGALVTADQFVYWDPTNPRRCLAPDLAVRVGARSEILPIWKTWERGAPHVGVEIASGSERDPSLAEKLERYRQAGVGEVVWFDPDSTPPGLRIWDLVEGDLVEREPSAPEARRCDALGLYWCILPDEKLVSTLRLARSANGDGLLPTPEEAAAAREEAATAREEAATAREEAALLRVAELEAELTRRG